MQISNELSLILGEANVIPEWPVARNTQDALTRALYCPRIDIAVGPFNIDRNLWRNNSRILDAYQTNRNLINAIKAESDVPNQALELNENPRCFLAFEIENRTGAKHRIGSIMNASAIGTLGIIVTNTEADFDRVIKIREYLEFLVSVGKTRYNPKNVLTILADDLFRVLNQFHH